MKNISLSIIVSTFILASCGGGGGGGGGGTTPTPPTTPTPTVNLSAEPTSVLLESTSTLTWSSTNATSCSASWTSQTGSSGSEAVTISTVGNNSFSITCSGAGGSRSASVTVEGYRETDGVVVDGYISGAEVCIDEDESWTCDSNESSTTSDNNGKFTIKYANGNLVSIGGTDLDSQTLLDNLLITHKLTGHSDFKAVTPVTSIAAFMADASLVNSALGIDSSIDVSTFDPVANKGDGGINDFLYEKGNQLTVLAYALQNITNNLNTTTETTQDYFKAITEEIEKEYTETTSKVDIETEEFITKTLDNIVAAKTVTITDEAKANTTKALSGVMPVIEVKSSDDLTTSVIRFAVSTLQTDIQAIANGTASAETVASYTSDVLTYIAEDQNIEADEITPDISAIADSATTSEDTSVTINVVVNDSYLTSAPISVSAGNGSNGTTILAESSPEQIVYTPNADYNGTDTFSYTITQGDKTSSADVAITIEAVNDAPTIDTASTIQAAENQTAVATISVSDVDEDDLTLTLSGTDAGSLDLSTENVLTFKEAPDFETKSSYSITLSLTDGAETVTKDVTISITNVNDIAPVITSNSAFTADENQTAIGSVVATDADGDDLIFSLGGTNASSFNISSTGVMTFKTNPDYETKSSYEITVSVSDGTNTVAQDISIEINNINEIHVVSLSSSSINENISGGIIGALSSPDPDGPTDKNSSYTYALTADSIFFIDSSNNLRLKPSASLDFETKNSYSMNISSTDLAGLKAEIQFNLIVVDVNEAPILTNSTTGYDMWASLNQTLPLLFIDPDANDVLTLSINGGSDKSFFKINESNSSGYTLGFSSLPNAVNYDDANTDGIYSVQIRATDIEGLYVDSVFSITLQRNLAGSSRLNLNTELTQRAGSFIGGATEAGVGDTNGDGISDMVGSLGVIRGSTKKFPAEVKTIKTQNGSTEIEFTDDVDGCNVSNNGAPIAVRYQMGQLRNLDGDNNIDLLGDTSGSGGNLAGVKGEALCYGGIGIIFSGNMIGGLQGGNASADIDGDGRDDLILIISDGLKISTTRTGDGNDNAPEITLSASGDKILNAYEMGDINNDGFADLLIKMETINSSSQYGRVLFGRKTWSNFDLSIISDSSDGFVINKDTVGGITGVYGTNKDINGDGYNDFALNDWIIYGRSSWPITMDVNDNLAPSNGFKVTTTFGQTGYTYPAIYFPGDVNSDGYEDFIYGSSNEIGQATIYWGRSSFNDFDGSLDDGAKGVVLVASLNLFGEYGIKAKAVASDVDMNGDGYDDLLLINGGGEGGYLIYGGAFSDSINFIGSSVGDSMTGSSANDIFASGRGADTIITSGGTDTVYSGLDDDIISIDNFNFKTIDAGHGTDILKISKAIDVTLTSLFSGIKIQNIEKIDTNNNLTNIISIGYGNVVSMTQNTNSLIIEGDNKDSIQINSEFTKDTSYSGDNDKYISTRGPAVLFVSKNISIL